MTLVRMLPLCLKLTTTNPTSFLIYLTLPYLNVLSNLFCAYKNGLSFVPFANFPFS